MQGLQYLFFESQPSFLLISEGAECFLLDRELYRQQLPSPAAWQLQKTVRAEHCIHIHTQSLTRISYSICTVQPVQVHELRIQYCIVRTVQSIHILMLQLLRYPDDSEMSEQFGRILEWSSYKRDTYRSVIDSNARLQRAPQTSLSSSSPSLPAVSSTTSLTANTISPLSLARRHANTTDQRAPPAPYAERQNGHHNKHYSEQHQHQENVKRLSLDVHLGPPQSSNNVLRAPSAQNLFIGHERSPRSEPERQLLLFDSHSTTS